MENRFLNKYAPINKLHMRVANQCAPLLYGVKISNILIIDNSEVQLLYQLFNNSLIEIKTICKDDQKTLLLLFNRENVQQCLMNKYVRHFMRQQGYVSTDLTKILSELTKRFTKFKEDKADFPHELGIILGYPIGDVNGFIQNRGKNSLYTGYWKVYGNLSGAKETFRKYDNAKEDILMRLVEGETIEEIIEEYQKYRTKTIYSKEMKAIGY